MSGGGAAPRSTVFEAVVGTGRTKYGANTEGGSGGRGGEGLGGVEGIVVGGRDGDRELGKKGYYGG